MGKASSNKKVARAASTSGGRTAGGRTPWVYYLTIIVIVLLGSAMVYASRHTRLAKANTVGATPPIVGQDHWHVAYSFYVCTDATKGDSTPPIPYQTDPDGVHTHGDGVIHIHPYDNAAAGKNAVLGVFTKAVGVTLNAGELKLPSVPAANGNKGYGGHDYHDSDSCGGKPGRVQVQVFSGPTDTAGKLWTKDPRLVPFADKQMITVAFLPKGEKIPPPPQANIDAAQKPLDVPSTVSPDTTTTTVPGAPTTTVPGATTTTAPGATTTTAPGATTTSTVK